MSGHLPDEVDLVKVQAALEAADLRRVLHFLALSDEMHFHRAAQRLFLSQPALSQSLQRLERSLGVTLLERSSRRVKPTPAGRVLMEEAPALLAHFQRVIERTRSVGAVASQRLSIGYTAACERSVGELIGAFSQQHPEVSLDYRQDRSDRLQSAVVDDSLDVAIALAGEVPGLSRAPFRAFPLFCAMTEDHPLAGEAELSYDVFATYPAVVVSSSAHPWSKRIREILSARGLEPEILPASDSFFEIPEAMRQAHGLWLVTDEYPLNGAVRVPMERSRERIRYDLFWRRGNRAPALLALLAVSRQLRQRRDQK